MTDQPVDSATAPDSAQPEAAAQPSAVVHGCLIAALVVAIPCYLFSFIGLLDSAPHNPDDGIVTGFAVLGEIALWMGLFLFVVLASVGTKLSGGMVAAAAAAIAAVALAATTALGLMGTDADWRVAAPILLPPLAVWFGFWLRRVDRLTAQQRRRGALVFAATAFLLVAPIAWSAQLYRADLAAQGRRYAAEEARRAAAFEAMWRAPNRGFEQLAPWLDDECPCDDTGFNGMTSRAARSAEAIRGLPTRQADAVRLLDGGFPLASLSRLHQLEVAATPELCRAYSGALDRRAGELDPANSNIAAVVGDLRLQLDNVYWFTANRCDLSVPAGRVARLSRALGDDRDGGLGEAFADTIRSAAAAPPCTPAPDNLCPRS
jgi:hypothetical protein